MSRPQRLLDDEGRVVDLDAFRRRELPPERSPLHGFCLILALSLAFWLGVALLVAPRWLDRLVRAALGA
jgi:hypothetical protein